MTHPHNNENYKVDIQGKLSITEWCTAEYNISGVHQTAMSGVQQITMLVVYSRIQC